MYAYLEEFWQHRELTRSFAMRDIKARYKQPRSVRPGRSFSPSR